MGPKSYRGAVNSMLKMAKQQGAKDRQKWGASSPPTFPKMQPKQDRITRSMTLSEAARAAGVTHESVLDLARPDLASTAAVADLKARYPGAFVKSVRDMTPAELRAFKKSAFVSEPQKVAHADKRFDKMTAREKEEFERSAGISVPWSEIIARRRVETRNT